MSYYDVRIGMDDKNTTSIVRSVNLMCALLKDVDYETLYEKPFFEAMNPECALNRMYFNAFTLHSDLNVNPAGKQYLVGPYIAEMLQELIILLIDPAAPPVHLKYLFLRHVDNASTGEDYYLYRIYMRLQKLFADHGDNLNHFCTPFMKMQMEDTYIDPLHWQDFMNNCRRHHLRQLFSLERGTAKGTAIANARSRFILTDGSKFIPYLYITKPVEGDPVHVTTPSGGNSRICQNGNSCVSSIPSNWCNLTEGGVCSAMSDH